MIKTIGRWLIAIISFTVSSMLIVAYTYSQRYVQDSPTTATTGIMFQKTLNLNEYRNISSGNGWLGKYANYSRSDRMDAESVLTIYCKSYCKK